jgi:hypothetical protein
LARIQFLNLLPEINLLKISKIINFLRFKTSKDEIVSRLKLYRQEVFNIIQNYEYEFNEERKKNCSRNAIKGVIDKWIFKSKIENGKRTNYNTKISEERIKHLVEFKKLFFILYYFSILKKTYLAHV